MGETAILIRGAREHNLQQVDLSLPRNRLICLTGVSGSGKSSLAFDTLYAEGQRRYVASLSSFARQFLGQMPKPDVDLIAGLSPSISISQKGAGQNPRSTVGTITEIYDYLRVLYARVGKPYCPQCDRPITAQTREQIIQQILALPAGTRFVVLAPLVRAQKGEHRDLFEDLLKQGFVRARVDGRIVGLTDQVRLDRRLRHDIEVVIDRLVAGPALRPRLAEAVDLALRLGRGRLIVGPDTSATEGARGNGSGAEDGSQNSGARRPPRAAGASQGIRPPHAQPRGSASTSNPPTLASDIYLSSDYACTHCNLSFEPLSPQLFSFNSPQGMCAECSGLGEIYSFDPERLIPDPSRSFQQGAIELVGRWREIGRWRRAIYRGVAEMLERKHGLAPGTVLETAWEELDPAWQQALLWGTGDEHVTFTWRHGPSGHKWGGKFEGIIPRLLAQYRSTRSRPQRRRLEKYMCVLPCARCGGRRLNAQACAVRLQTRSPLFAEQPERSLPEVCALPVRAAREFVGELELDETSRTIAAEAVKEISGRLGFLADVGLDYLTLDRTAPTLSGGEMQRIRLAGQIGCGLVGVTYILDEPSVGLHARDQQRLLDSLARLRDQGNTVVVVEHDEATMRAADHLVDFGPGPGMRGGRIVAHGPLDRITAESESITGQYLSGKRRIAVPARRREPGAQRLVVRGAAHNNLQQIDVEIPLGLFVCVTGVSGSGKSSLVDDILVEALRRDLNAGRGDPGAHERIEGLEHLDRMIAIDQSPIGRTPRSNPATYTKLFDEIRKLYAQLPEAKARGYKPGRFSFNVSGGRCEACDGHGANRLEMDFLADVWVTCPVCQGRRFNRETLQVRFKGRSIAQVLEMDVQEALEHFENIPLIRRKLQTLHDVGLDYMKLGQPSPTLSGGEAQRVKLARELAKRNTGRTLYVLDEPTTGLHFADVELLLRVLHGFVDAGHTVLVVEHNLEVIKTADWIIDLGPEGGEAGGRVVAAGTPEQVARRRGSHTGRVLRGALGAVASRGRKAAPAARPRRRKPAPRTARQRTIRIRGARQHNLKDLDVDIPREELTVCCGPSGSGKTSLAMDTLYAEGQRRYVESLSAYARQFVARMQKPKLDHIEGLSPAVAIEQKHTGHTPRSTVGTVTEIYDYLRILMARLGQPHCPECNLPVGTQSADEIVAKIMEQPEGTRLYLTAPLELQPGERFETLWEELRASGYVRIRVDGRTVSLDEVPELDRRRRHRVEVVIDRVRLRPGVRSRIAGSVENALALGCGVLHAVRQLEDQPEPRWPVAVHSQHFACQQCGRSFEPLSPHHFSFNSALGWCPACEGLGVQTGTNPAALLRDPKLTLAQGAVALWPGTESRVFQLMLASFCRATGIPADLPFDELEARHRRLIYYGTGDQWFEVSEGGRWGGKADAGSSGAGSGRARKQVGAAFQPRAAGTARPVFRFQYKGLFPALEEGSRFSPSLRRRLAHLVDEVECSACGGSRLRDDAAAVRFRGRTMDQWCRLPLGRLLEECRAWQLDNTEQQVAGELWREVSGRLQFLVDVGLEYLTLARPAPTLSGGEMQRIRLAAQLGSGLCGVLYVLDEPTIGLHPRDNHRLLSALRKLRDLGNTLVVVEHDREVVQSADRLLDFGPAAGRRGGRIVAQGTPATVARRRNSVTGPYLAGRKSIPVPTNRRMGSAGEASGKSGRAAGRMSGWASGRTPGGGWLEIVGARQHNLQNINVRIPLGTLTVVTGVSGSGKSSLVDDILYRAAARRLHRAHTQPGAHDRICGLEQINKVIRVDQEALGQTPTSNPATFTGLFDLVRNLFAQLPEARLRGYTPRRFSFNVPGGRCEKCEGNGQLKIEMHFLPDVWVECDTCRGRRYNPETLAVKYCGRTIADVLDMPCDEALKLFENIPRIRRILQMLCDVGLGYLTLGQPAHTLSGGEAQRVKLAAELARPDTGRTLYLLDEPTTGLHFDDLARLLDVLNRLVDLGNTVVVIEHNLDVIKTADWVIDLGPEAGDQGGHLAACGTPEDIVEHARRWQQTRQAPHTNPPKRPRRSKHASTESQASDARPEYRSYTGEALAPVLERGPHEPRRRFDPAAVAAPRPGDLEIDQLGTQVKMPWQRDGRKWHCEDRVARNGRPCRWEGRILSEVVDRIQQHRDVFGPVDWDARSVVEIRGQRSSFGWFFHAITGEEWLLKLKFRTARATFRSEELIGRLALTPLNDLPEVPLYGTGPRVYCRNIRGPWQEVELRVWRYDEIDRPEFWRFVDEAIAGFRRLVGRVEQSRSVLEPWKQLGRTWHLARRGFPLGRSVRWPAELLEELLDLVAGVAPDAQVVWTHKQVVPFYVAGQREPWVAVRTKKTDAIHLHLAGPKGALALGELAAAGWHPQFDGRKEGIDRICIKLHRREDLRRETLVALLRRHLGAVRAAAPDGPAPRAGQVTRKTTAARKTARTHTSGSRPKLRKHK